MKIQEFRKEGCPICGNTGWCSRREDGLIFCKRPPTPPNVEGYDYVGMASDAQTGMYVVGGTRHHATAQPGFTKPEPGVQANFPRAKPTAAATTEAVQSQHAESVSMFTADRRTALASELGLPEAALGTIEIGWNDLAQHHAAHDIKGAWVLPEYDGQGRMIGTTFRFPSQAIAGKTDADGKPLGNKSAPSGQRRGLTLPANWKEMHDPVLVVEGPSDVLAGRAVGLNVLGRPSSTGGVELLAQTCLHRQVIILGENDRKSDGRWPGKEGAELVAHKLEAHWGRPVPMAFPPEGIKDLRDWIRHLALDWSEANVAATRGAILTAVQPPALLLMAQADGSRGRATVKVFRWGDGVDGAAIHSDLLHIEKAAARKQFVKDVSVVAPESDTDELGRRLLSLKVPAAMATVHDPGSDTGSGDTPLPQVYLYGGDVLITESAERLGYLLAQTEKYFLRGGAVVRLSEDDDEPPVLQVVEAATLTSDFEKVAKLVKPGGKEGAVAKGSTCAEQEARLIMKCPAFKKSLPLIRLLSQCPVLIEGHLGLEQICGYDPDSGILAFGERVHMMPQAAARALLLDAISDFRFASKGDKARALASILTPALVFGGLLGGRAPMDLTEANASQAGKGFRNKITAAIYNHPVTTITQKTGGVGSMEESFATALIKGHTFISIDNVRGAIDSPAIESFLTEDRFSARVPYMGAVDVDPRRVILQLTSNRTDLTVDLANRSSCVRILKQPDGYRFQKYPEGDILDHIRANQPLYLGAVYSILVAWHGSGKLKTREARHDFRPWAQTLGWIIQHMFQMGPLLDGHRQAQARISTPAQDSKDLTWLQGVASAVRNHGRMDTWLRARDLIGILSKSGSVAIPGLPEGGDLADAKVLAKVLQALGLRMTSCFRGQSTVALDGITVEHHETTDAKSRRVQEYRFVVEKTLSADLPYEPEVLSGCLEENTEGQADSATPKGTGEAAKPLGVAASADSPLSPPCSPGSVSAGKPQCSSISPMTSVTTHKENKKTEDKEEVCIINHSINKEGETPRGPGELAETAGTPASVPEEEEVLV